MHTPAPAPTDDRLLAAVGFLSEVRSAGVNCTLTSRSREDLRRLAANGDEDALAEWFRRQFDAEQLEIPEEFRAPIVEAAAELVAA